MSPLLIAEIGDGLQVLRLGERDLREESDGVVVVGDLLVDCLCEGVGCHGEAVHPGSLAPRDRRCERVLDDVKVTPRRVMTGTGVRTGVTEGVVVGMRSVVARAHLP